MKSQNPIINELKAIRDEVKVQAHLFSMDTKQKYEELEKRFTPFERKIENYVEKFGKLNEEFWTGNLDEIKKYKKEYEEIKEGQGRLNK